MAKTICHGRALLVRVCSPADYTCSKYVRCTALRLVVFTALYGMQTQSSDENSVVCPCDKRVNCDKTKERLVQNFYTYEKSFSQTSFLRKRMAGGGHPFYLNFGSAGPVEAKSPILNR